MCKKIIIIIIFYSQPASQLSDISETFSVKFDSFFNLWVKVKYFYLYPLLNSKIWKFDQEQQSLEKQLDLLRRLSLTKIEHIFIKRQKVRGHSPVSRSTWPDGCYDDGTRLVPVFVGSTCKTHSRVMYSYLFLFYLFTHTQRLPHLWWRSQSCFLLCEAWPPRS